MYSNGTAQLLNDYNTLQSQYNKLNTTLLVSSNMTATSLTPPTCNANLISSDGFSTDFNIPSPPQGASELISSGVSSAPTGSIVSVTATSVAVSVYATNGAQITGLAIKPVANNAQNTPDGQDTGASATGSASSSATGTASGSSASSGSSSATGAAASASATTGAGSVNGAAGGVALAAAVGAGLLAL